MKILAKKKEIQIRIWKNEKNFYEKVELIEKLLKEDCIIRENTTTFFVRSWEKGAKVDYDFISFVKANEKNENLIK